MRWVHGAGRVLGATLWLVALAPILALGPAAVLDRGPGGSVRATPFPVVLAAFDPFVWISIRNSFAVAMAVTLAAGLIGVGLAQVAVRRSFWGRRPLALLASAGLAVPPAFGAIGLCWLVRPSAIMDRSSSSFWSGMVVWSVWFWVALAASAPLVGLAAAAALRDVDPVWEDAARLAGAGRRRAWRELVWPIVRPDVARTLALVFGLTLLDPAAPIVLGLRRTLGFQIVAEAIGAREPGRLSRAVALALFGTLLALLARELLHWWGGRRPAGLDEASGPPVRTEAWSWRGASLAVVAFLAAVAIVWIPALSLLAGSLGIARPGATAPAATVSFSAYTALFGDPLLRQYLRNSAALALAVVAFDLLLARAAVSLLHWFGGRVSTLARWPEAVPPLALGVGALALPSLMGMAAELAAPGGSRPGPFAVALRALADALDLHRTPGLALVLAIASARLSLTVLSALERHGQLRRDLVDAAVILGSSRGQARRTLTSRFFLGASPAAAVLTLALAATNPVPALVLSPTAETRPLGPAILSLADSPAAGSTHTAALASAAVALNLLALSLAARGRSRLAHACLRA